MTRLAKVTAGLFAVLAFVVATALAWHAHGAVVVRTAVAYRPHPVARAVAVSAAATATAIAVGTVVRSLPPSCRAVVVGNVAYQQCGSTWYQPRYAGSQVTYVVVTAPR